MQTTRKPLVACFESKRRIAFIAIVLTLELSACIYIAKFYSLLLSVIHFTSILLLVLAFFFCSKKTEQELRKRSLHASKILNNSLFTLSHAIAQRDRYTGFHSLRVARNSRIIGLDYGLSSSEISRLYWAALLHDIGKIVIPDSILKSDRRVTNKEDIYIIKKHPEEGGRLIEKISKQFEDIAVAVRQHHERWDGKGYPKGIREQDISLYARIISVADVYDALTSDRPYRKAFPREKAMRYLLENSATQFDPSVVHCFLNAFREKRLVEASDRSVDAQDMSTLSAVRPPTPREKVSPQKIGLLHEANVESTKTELRS